MKSTMKEISESVSLSEEQRRVREEAHRCMAEARALMSRLDWLDLQWARVAREGHSDQLHQNVPSDPSQG